MGKKLLIGLGLLLVLLFAGTCSSQGMGDTKYYDWMGTPIISGSQGAVTYPDWLSPSTAGRPDWDPYGPGSIYYPAAGKAAWDPYAPVYGRDILNMEPADPAAAGLTVQGNLRTPNQLYLQRDGFLVTDGRVALGEPYVLWANLGYNGPFVLYDNGEAAALSQTYLRPGWYRITGLYSEILSSHLYRFTSAGLNSNQLPVMVDTGGYPTGFGLTGRVVDISGNGIPGVKVVISGSDGGVFTTTTSAQGYYGFDATSGTYTVTAELPGYSFTPSTARVWTGTVSVAQTITGYAAGAQPPTTQATQTPAGAQVYDSQPYGSQLYTGDLAGYTGWVQGKLTDQSGAPISQAVIRADSLRTSVTSDAQGNYKIALNPGMHRIDAEKAGYGIPLRAVLVLSGQTSTLDLIGKRTATLGSGR
jgi:hypothetical protein